MRAVFRNHGLSITMIGMFLVFFVGQVPTGRHEHSPESKEVQTPHSEHEE